MIWKLCNFLFGWDYIVWHNSADQGIARVRVDHNGNLYYWRYKSSKIADPITKVGNHLWLTCSPEKYFSDSEVRIKE